jgi:hypothetical protein
VTVASNVWSSVAIKLPVIFTTGIAVAALIWKLAEKVENVLTEDTKLQIAVWLLDLKPLAGRMQRWPETFRTVFNVVFGARFLSWKCFFRSCLYSACSAVVVFCIWFLPQLDDMREDLVGFPLVVVIGVIIFAMNVLPDYIALGETRLLFRLLIWRSNALAVLGVLVLDLLFSFALPLGSALLVQKFDENAPGVVVRTVNSLLMESFTYKIDERFKLPTIAASGSELMKGMPLDAYRAFWCYPSVLTSIWIWLYVLAGWLIKIANRFDLGFGWFVRHMDIEKKPLQAIGMVIGGIVAVLCWVGYVVTQRALPGGGAAH